MKAAKLNQALHDHFSEEELAGHFSIRGYKLTPKREQILEQYKGIIDRHPKKNLWASDFWIDFLLNCLVTNIWNPLPFRVQW